MSTLQLSFDKLGIAQGKFPKVSIIILNWNGWQDTLECLDSLKKITYRNYEAIIVDNASKNDSVSQIKNYLAKNNPPAGGNDLNFITLDSNLGFAGGNNAGVKRALKQKVDYILLLNNDTIVAPDFLDKLVEAGESDPKCGIAGPKIYFETDKNRIWFGGGYFSWFGGGRHLEYDVIDKNPDDRKTKEVDYMTGCCFLIKRAALEKIGLMNEDFFLYYEDTEWSLRAREQGYKIIYAPSSRIWHKVSRSTKPETNKKVFYYHIRNALLLSKLRAPAHILAGIYIWSVLCYFKQIIKKVFLPSKKETAEMIMRGIEDFYKGKFGIYTNN
jgi:GT2 family glycosyltransferase